MKAKEITIQIIDGEKDKHYLIEVMTKGKEAGQSAVLPQNKLAITDENGEVHMRFNLHTEYTIRISESFVEDIDTFFEKKKSGATLAGPLLKTVPFTPEKGKDILEIRLAEEASR